MKRLTVWGLLRPAIKGWCSMAVRPSASLWHSPILRFKVCRGALEARRQLIWGGTCTSDLPLPCIFACHLCIFYRCPLILVNGWAALHLVCSEVSV